MLQHADRPPALSQRQLCCHEPTGSAQQMGPRDLFVDSKTSNINALFSFSVASHRQRRCFFLETRPLGSSRSTFLRHLLSPRSLAEVHADRLKRPIIAHSLELSGWGAGICDTPCPWIMLESGEITAFCHLACQSLAAADRRRMCQTGERSHSQNRVSISSVTGPCQFHNGHRYGRGSGLHVSNNNKRREGDV